MRLYLGNLAFSTTDEDLRELFGPHGNVTDVRVVSDRDTGRSRGFGFVEFSNDDEARAAMAALNQQEVEGRTITVNEARERTGGGGGGRDRR